MVAGAPRARLPSLPVIVCAFHASEGVTSSSFGPQSQGSVASHARTKVRAVSETYLVFPYWASRHVANCRIG
ncbi:hypothetical protein CKAH01_02886 [Colletotrichum kahawae]|uniref:Uncharacterized protein n=1 Tax=Colletotrichum kahawae TaxID=34407 RepID=A0AAE0CX60_COLKA|nr:hypothetical protein CKAH01_02886 [Colletotrichum kahawae]